MVLFKTFFPSTSFRSLFFFFLTNLFFFLPCRRIKKGRKIRAPSKLYKWRPMCAVSWSFANEGWDCGGEDRRFPKGDYTNAESLHTTTKRIEVVIQAAADHKSLFVGFARSRLALYSLPSHQILSSPMQRPRKTRVWLACWRIHTSLNLVRDSRRQET
jgi:hypothetical protein